MILAKKNREYHYKEWKKKFGVIPPYITDSVHKTLEQAYCWSLFDEKFRENGAIYPSNIHSSKLEIQWRVSSSSKSKGLQTEINTWFFHQNGEFFGILLQIKMWSNPIGSSQKTQKICSVRTPIFPILAGENWDAWTIWLTSFNSKAFNFYKKSQPKF